MCSLSIFSNLLFTENYRKLSGKLACVGFLLLNSKNMAYSRSQDAKELLQSPQGAQAKGDKSGQRLSHSFRLGELSLGHVLAAKKAFFWKFLICVIFLLISFWALCPIHILVYQYCFIILFYLAATENPSELQPKSTVGGQLNESMFLLRYVKWQRGKESVGEES